MAGEPLDLFSHTSGDCRIKAGQILKRLRGKFDAIAQARLSLRFTDKPASDSTQVSKP